VDEQGGIYVPGTKKLHKLIWKDGGFSDDPNDGAWVEAYEIGSLDETLRAERGSGTTPALMGGPGDKDKFVVFADAANVNNLILYWRNEIPADWKQIPGTSSRRIAGLLPVDFGDKSLTSSYSENSATIFDYGAVLANNQVKTNEKMMLDVQLKMKDPKRTPYGVQKFQWNPETREWKVAWTRPDVSSPNSTPVVTTKNRQLHTVGLQDGKWTMQTLDWRRSDLCGIRRRAPSAARGAEHSWRRGPAIGEPSHGRQDSRLRILWVYRRLDRAVREGRWRRRRSLWPQCGAAS
jgi:hypothetical protein